MQPPAGAADPGALRFFPFREGVADLVEARIVLDPDFLA